MTAQDCLQILREVKHAAFATVDENGYPQVRIIDVMLVEDGTIYFCTARGKDFYQQLARTGRAAVTALNKDYQMVRLSGKVKRLTDSTATAKEDGLKLTKEVYPQDSRYILEPFCFEEGQVEFFDLGKSPIYRENFTLGDVKKEQKGYEITDECIGCGTCMEGCPQRCIEEGTPFSIRQENCLHCGLCAENCPVQAIRKRGR